MMRLSLTCIEELWLLSLSCLWFPLGLSHQLSWWGLGLTLPRPCFGQASYFPHQDRWFLLAVLQAFTRHYLPNMHARSSLDITSLKSLHPRKLLPWPSSLDGLAISSCAELSPLDKLPLEKILADPIFAFWTVHLELYAINSCTELSPLDKLASLMIPLKFFSWGNWRIISFAYYT